MPCLLNVRLSICVLFVVLTWPTGAAIAHDDHGCEDITPVAGDRVTLELVSSALSDPVEATAPRDDFGRLFVVEKPGRIRIVFLHDDSLQSAAEPFLDISTRSTPSTGERGLLGLAFHPEYATNGYFYVYYTRGDSGAVCTAQPVPGCPDSRSEETVISRFEVSADDPNRADPGSEQVLLTFCQPFRNHNAGKIAFGPLDGFLYIATGDGGSGGDPCNSGQRTDTFLGKILRLDVDAGDPYAIPEGNPFATEENDPGDAVLDEIWSLGLRNPWRFCFDDANGDIYIGDVGQNDYEEIDYSPGTSQGGENYQWRRIEGEHSFNSGTALTVGDSMDPLLEYAQDSGFTGCSVTGGEVYRGCKMPALHGSYFFADYCANWVRTLRVEAGGIVDIENRTAELNEGILPDVVDDISAFGKDAHGEIYVCDLGSKLFRIVPVTTPNNPPTAAIATNPDPATVTLGQADSRIFLDGASSDDGDGGLQGLSYAWERLSGPTSDTIEDPVEASTFVSFVEPGDYVYRLTVDDGQDTDTAEAAVTVLEAVLPGFVRGDSNVDGIQDISDAVFTLNHLFLGDPSLVTCRDALDSDDDGELILTDPVYYLNFLFLGGPVPPAPWPECGPDGTDDDALECEEFPCP